MPGRRDCGRKRTSITRSHARRLELGDELRAAAAARTRSSTASACDHARACRRSAPRRTRRSSPRRSRPTCSTASALRPHRHAVRPRARRALPARRASSSSAACSSTSCGRSASTDVAHDDERLRHGDAAWATSRRAGDRPARAPRHHARTSRGDGVEPLVHRGYNGGTIELPRGGTVLDPERMPELTREARPRHRHDQRRHAARRRRQGRRGRGDGGGRLPRRAPGAAARDASRSASRPTRRSARARTCSTSTASARACAYTFDGSEAGEFTDETFTAASADADDPRRRGPPGHRRRASSSTPRGWPGACSPRCRRTG